MGVRPCSEPGTPTSRDPKVQEILKKQNLQNEKQYVNSSSSSSSSSRNEHDLGGTIALLLQDHRTVLTKSVCNSQYMVIDQH